MRIAIDCSAAAKEKRTGVGKYVERLVKALAEVDRENTYYLCHRLSRLPERKHFLRVGQPNFRNRLIQEPFHFLLMPGLDVFHGPDARLPACRRVKSVVTFHDVFSLVSEEFADERFRRMKAGRYRDLVARASCIIAVSESTKRAIVEHLGADPSRIRVVPEGVPEEFRPREAEEQAAVARKHGIQKDFLLYVGAVTRRKNIRRMVQAFGQVAKARDVVLVLAGRPSFGAEGELAAIDELGLGDRVRLLGFVPDEDLPALYSAARLLLFPSLCEGFGMPLLEAMACGTPAVTSNASSLPEVAGEAALLVDPTDTKAIAEATLRLLEEEPLRQRLREKGIERARLFPWTRTARETLAAYRDAGVQ